MYYILYKNNVLDTDFMLLDIWPGKFNSPIIRSGHVAFAGSSGSRRCSGADWPFFLAVVV